MRTLLMTLVLFVMAAPRSGAADSAFSVQKIGKGQPMILIPGLLSSGAVWSSTVDRYKDRYELHVLTLAGFAGQRPLDGDAFLPIVRDAIVRYIRDQKLDRPVIVGHSLGGFLGFWIAATAPDAVGGVIAVDGVPFLPALTNPGATADTSRPVAEQMRTVYASFTPAQLVAPSKMAMVRMMRAESDVERTLAWVAASDPATTGRATYELLVTDLRKDVSAITAPVLLVGAEAPASDAAARARLQAAYEAQVAAVPRHTVVMIERARHFIMFDEPDALWSTMDTFLAGLSAGAK